MGTSNNYASGVTNTELTVDPSGYVGINQAAPSYNLDVTGTVRLQSLTNTAGVGTVCLGSGYPLSWINSNTCVPSDRRFKERIEPLQSALGVIGKLRPVTFYWNKLSKNPDKRRRIGLITQEVELLIPEVVNTDSRGIKSVSYDYLASPIIKAIQELKKMVDDTMADLKKLADHVTTGIDPQLAELKKQNDALKAANDALAERIGKLETARGAKAENAELKARTSALEKKLNQIIDGKTPLRTAPARLVKPAYPAPKPVPISFSVQ